MGVLEYLLLILVVGGGAFVQRVTGFGMGIFAMLFLPYFMPSHGAAVAVMGMIGSIGALYNAVRHRRDIQLKIMLPLVCAAMAVIPLAVHLSGTLPQSVIKRLLGVVLVALSVYFLFFSKRIHLKPTVPNGILAGVLAGHEAGARRGADGASGIGLGKAHALGSHFVKVGGGDEFLSVTAQIAVSHVVAHYKYYIRSLLRHCKGGDSAQYRK